MASLERLFAWGLIGAILGVAGIAISIYYQRLPRMEFAILSESDVVQVRQSVGNLRVLFGDRDILKEGLRLRLFVVRVANDGRADVLQTHYDSSLPFGIEVTDAKVIDVQMANSNSEYLANSLKPRVVGDTRVEFDKVIFEQDRSAIISLLLIAPVEAIPGIKPLGKIAGIERISCKTTTSGQGTGFWARVAGGHLWVQLARGPIYFMAFLLVVFGIGGTAAFVGDRVGRLRRQRTVRTFAYSSSPELRTFDEYLICTYVDEGAEGVGLILWHLNYPTRPDVPISQMTGLFVSQGEEPPPGVFVRRNLRSFDTLEKAGAIVKDRTGFVASPAHLSRVEVFARFLSERGIQVPAPPQKEVPPGKN